MFKLIDLNCNVMLNGYSQWLNIRGGGGYWEICINCYQCYWPSVIKKMMLNVKIYYLYVVCTLI